MTVETWPSPAQLRICIAHEMAPTVPAFNHAVVFDVPPTVDTSRLQSAVLGATAAHQALRCRLRPGGDVGWTVHDGLPARLAENLVLLGPSDLESLAELDLARPFNLRSEPPVRVSWWTTGLTTRAQMTFHHVATDARTLGLLLSDIGQRYETGRGRSTRYYDLVEDHWLRHPDYERRLDDYALDVVEADLSPLFSGIRRPDLPPLEHLRPVPEGVATRVLELARRFAVTPFSVWLTAWSRALSRLLDRSSYPLLVPVSTRRNRAELDAIGFFVSSVVIPIRQDHEEVFSQALVRTSDQVLMALSRRDLPLDQLARQLDLDHRGQDNPLTQVSAQMVVGPADGFHTSDGHVEAHLVDSPVARYQLSFDVHASDGGNELRVRADAGLVEQARLTALTELVLAELSAPLRARRSMKAEVTTAPGPVGSGLVTSPRTLVHGLLERLAAAPSDTAVEWFGGRWSSDDLRRAIDEVTSQLEGAGCEPGDAVLFDLPRGPGLVAAFVAVLKMDGVPVFQRPGFSDATRQEIQRLTACSAAVRGGPVDIVVEALEHTPSTHVPPGTAYVTFTSGSSGAAPKGVPTPTLGAIGYLSWIRDELALTSHDRCLQLARPGFDALARDVLAPLQVGATLVIASDKARRHGAALRATLEEQAVTVVPAMVPTQLRRLVHGARSQEPMKNLRVLCVAGEPVMRDDVADLPAIAPGCRLLNLYGPTETTMTTTALDIPMVAHGPARLPVGAPIPGTAVHVVDGHGAVLPPGCLGRVIVTGVGVAPRYLHETGGPSASFGWWTVGGEVVLGFTTDDLGFWLDDGGLRVEGRVGTERKLYGERLDLAAVEAALTSHASVADAIVGIDGEGSDAMLVANVVWSTKPDPAGVRQHLQQRLPPVAIPRHTVGVDDVPRLANGKVDRTRDVVRQPQGEDAAPSQAEQKAMAAVARVVGEWTFSRDTSLFDLGCDSLDLVEIAEVAGIRSGSAHRLGELFDEPTVGTIARLIATTASTGDDAWRWSSLSLLGPPRAPGGFRLVACPPAGSDAPVFQPLLPVLTDVADVAVLRRPQAARRRGTARAWLEDHAWRAVDELLSDEDQRPLVVCGYSVGFVVACVVVSALNARGIRPQYLIGLNPTVPGAEPSGGGAVDSPQREPVLAARWHHDFRLRGAVPRRPPEADSTLLFLGPEDRRRWASVGEAAMASLPHVEVVSLDGAHTIDDEEMARVGIELRVRLTSRDEDRSPLGDFANGPTRRPP